MIKHLIKDLEWFRGDNCIRVAYSPSHEYKLLADDSKYKVAYFELEAKNKEPVKFATGFTTLEQAKEWAYDHHCEKLSRWLNPDPLTDTINWFKEAKPEPTDKDKLIQTGCHFEEVCEHLEAMGCEGGELGVMAYELKTYTKEQPDSVISEKLNEFNNLDLLDALADQIVTATGVAYMMGFDIIGALAEVNASNWSKFEDGEPLFDENGKIVKGEGYFKPELGRFVGGSDE